MCCLESAERASFRFFFPFISIIRVKYVSSTFLTYEPYYSPLISWQYVPAITEFIAWLPTSCYISCISDVKYSFTSCWTVGWIWSPLIFTVATYFCVDTGDLAPMYRFTNNFLSYSNLILSSSLLLSSSMSILGKIVW